MIFFFQPYSRVPKHFQCTWINAIDERRIWTLLFIWETTFSPKKCSAICRDSSVEASSDLQVHFSKIILHSFAIWWKIWTAIYFRERNRRKRMRTFSKKRFLKLFVFLPKPYFACSDLGLFSSLRSTWYAALYEWNSNRCWNARTRFLES